MSEQQHAINVYTCPACGWRAVTVNLVAGTTPMFIQCEGSFDCARKFQGNRDYPGAVSAMYRVPQDLEPTHEWYKPTEAEIVSHRAAAIPAIRQHVELGGLLLRQRG